MKRLVSLLVVATALVAGTIAASSSGAATTVQWSPAQQVPGLAAISGGDSSELFSVSCTAGIACAGVGRYSPIAGRNKPVSGSFVDGGFVDVATFPDVDAFDVGNGSFFVSVSCTPDMWCSTIGNYTTVASSSDAFLMSDTDPHPSPVPGLAALDVGHAAGGDAISCTDADTCSATGTYTDGASSAQTYVVDRTGGTWGNAQPIDVTAIGATFGVPRAFTCWSATDCVLVGFSDQGAFIAERFLGVWATPMAVPGLSTLVPIGLTDITDVSCTPTGDCAITGLSTQPGRTQPFVVTKVNGVWNDAIELPAINAMGTSNSLRSVSCWGADECIAIGYTFDVVTDPKPVMITYSNGTWGAPIPVPGVVALAGTRTASGVDISCDENGMCALIGSYLDAQMNGQSFVALRVDGVWQDAIAIPGLVALNTGNDATARAVSCATGLCMIVGTASVGSGGAAFEAVVQASTPEPTTTTTTDPTTTSTTESVDPVVPAFTG